ncbi:hypothetical protein SAMN04487981_110303 [Streptomyces sp. cf386]|nr:hypothetical protein SAMN04487981_110303 [Streptomyces sp. cf386]
MHVCGLSIMRPTLVRLSNSLRFIPPDRDTPTGQTVPELPSAPVLSCINSSHRALVPQAVLHSRGGVTYTSEKLPTPGANVSARCGVVEETR